MSENSHEAAPTGGLVGIAEVRHNWGWFVALGVLLIIVGIAAIGSSFWATLATVLVFGWLLIVGGAIQAANFLWRKKWKGYFIDLLSALLYLFIGFVLVANPLRGAMAITLIIGISLIVGGVFRIAAGFMTQVEHRIWLLLHGVISLLLGGAIWMEWPSSGIWVIGLFVGIDMLIGGWALVMLGLTAKNLPDDGQMNPTA